MDIRLLQRVSTVEWATCDRALDLACSTRGIGTWLRTQGVALIHGVDFTPAVSLEDTSVVGRYGELKGGHHEASG